MITIVKGNLLQAREEIIAHSCNCQSKMGSGVAWQIRNKFPRVYNEYRNLCNGINNKEDLLGHCQIIRVNDDKYVANLFGQLNYGYDGELYTDVPKLKEALIKLEIRAKHNKKSVAMPYKIGSDRGGADWDEVYAILEKVFIDYPLTLYKLN